MVEFKLLTAQELQRLTQDGDVAICDIRENDEYNHEHIVGAQNIPLSAFDIDVVNQLAATHKIVLHCQSGNRTELNKDKFAKLNCKEIFILCGGIIEWKKYGFATEKNSAARLPIMRQVQIVAGSLIILGVILGFIVSPYFSLLSGFVGLGLIFAGISGCCGMANLLMCLPYNRKSGKAACQC